MQAIDIQIVLTSPHRIVGQKRYSPVVAQSIRPTGEGAHQKRAEHDERCHGGHAAIVARADMAQARNVHLFA